MRFIRNTLLAAALCGLAAPPAPAQPAEPIAPPASPPAKEEKQEIAATVNGQPIPEKDVRRSLQGIPEEEHAKARPEIVNYLVENALIDQYLKALKIPVGPEEVDAKLAEFKKEAEEQGQDYAKILRNLMLTEAEFKEQIAAHLRWEKFVEQQATEERLKKLFESDKEIFDGTLVRARHILLTPEAKDPKAVEQAKATLLKIRAEVEAKGAEALKKVPADADALAREQAKEAAVDAAFADAARQYSACPSKQDGGDVNWFPRAGSMVEPFARAAFALKPFEVSDVVETPFGYHLILVTARRPGQPTKFEDVKEAAREVYGHR
ncbi:MAG TPA: peptidylprolyl isomerase, partial [Gemmataceae bacterium]